MAELLATNLHLLSVKNGCIGLTFGTLHELEAIFPLTLEQEKKLCQMGVTRLYSKDQDYYYNKSLLHSEGEDHDFPVITKSHGMPIRMVMCSYMEQEHFFAINFFFPLSFGLFHSN